MALCSKANGDRRKRNDIYGVKYLKQRKLIEDPDKCEGESLPNPAFPPILVNFMLIWVIGRKR